MLTVYILCYRDQKGNSIYIFQYSVIIFSVNQNGSLYYELHAFICIKIVFELICRSGSYPSEVVNSVEGQHVKTGSFDSSMYPSHGSKHSKHKVPHREK